MALMIKKTFQDHLYLGNIDLNVEIEYLKDMKGYMVNISDYLGDYLLGLNLAFAFWLTPKYLIIKLKANGKLFSLMLVY